MADQVTVTGTIGGNSIGGHVEECRLDDSVCSDGARGTLTLAPSFTATVQPWDAAVINVNNTKILTGYVDSWEARRPPGTYFVTFSDVMKRAREYFVTDTYTANGEDCGYWADYFLEMAGLTTGGSVATGSVVGAGFDWRDQYVSDIVKEVLGAAGGGWTAIADADGVVNIAQVEAAATADYTVSPITFQRTLSNEWIRNRAVVIGADDIYSTAGCPNSYIPAGVEWASLLVSGTIDTQEEADDLRDQLLDFFDEPLDMVQAEATGVATRRIGDTVEVADGWAGYTSGSALLTSISHRVDRQGYVQELTLNEKCLWGWTVAPTAGLATYIFYGTRQPTPDQARVAWSAPPFTSWADVWVEDIPTTNCVFAIASSGSLVGVFLQDTGNADVFFSKITALGSWTTPTVIHSSVNQVAGGDMYISPTDIGVVYAGATIYSPHCYFGRSTDQGATWSAQKDVSNESAQSQWTTITKSPNGNTHIVYYSGGSLRYVRSQDNGATWSSPVSITPDIDNYIGNIKADSQNRLFVSTQGYHPSLPRNTIEIVRSPDGGDVWVSPQTLYTGTQDYELVGEWRPRLRVDGSDRVHVVWADWGTSYSYEVLHYALSTDNGMTFTSGSVLTANDIEGYDVEFDDILGRVYLTYYYQYPGYYNIYMVWSDDLGTTWSEPVQAAALGTTNTTHYLTLAPYIAAGT